MKTRAVYVAKQEISFNASPLDEELNLFEETDWGFMDILDTQGKNYEYFNDIRDTEFDKGHFTIRATDLMSILALVLVIILGVVVVSLYTGAFKTQDYNNIAGMQSVMERTNVDKIEGTSVSSEELVAISELLNKYFNCLKAEDDYSALYDYCATTSTFADTYYQATERVVETYDKNDSYARALRKFASFCGAGKISDVVQKDGVYYCYVQLTYPNTADVQEYINLYSYNMTKFFGSHDLNDSNVIRFLMDTAEVNPMNCHTEDYCIRLGKVDGGFRILNDSFLTDFCANAYSDAISQVVSLLGNSSVTP